MANATTPTVGPRIGAVLRQARVGAGISRMALARQAEVDHTHIARFENGERPMSEVAFQHCLYALAELMAPRDGDSA